jgi:ABC-type branched-subunit amino acid transport system ATPase component
MLSVAGVSAGYGRLEILHKVALDVAPGEIVGIIGPNGAGKSTLLKTIFGYLSPFEGTVTFEDKPLHGRSPDQVMRRGIGYVAQAGGIFADMSVHENLVLGGYSLKSGSAVKTAIEKIYAQFPRFRERSKQRAGSLSGGEQQMLAIARAMMLEPKIILLDEPTEGLMPRMVSQIRQIIDVLHNEGVAILLVEQNVPLTLAASQRLYIMEKGSVRHHCATSEIDVNHAIIKQYLGV